MTEREGPITELVNYPSSLFFLLFALRASILLPSFHITLLLVFSFFLYHSCLILSQMYNLKVIEHYELVCLQYVIHCKNTKLSMRIYKHCQGSTRIYKLYNFPPPESLFE